MAPKGETNQGYDKNNADRHKSMPTLATQPQVTEPGARVKRANVKLV
jgi:hypothetical protein